MGNLSQNEDISNEDYITLILKSEGSCCVQKFFCIADKVELLFILIDTFEAKHWYKMNRRHFGIQTVHHML